MEENHPAIVCLCQTVHQDFSFTGAVAQESSAHLECIKAIMKSPAKFTLFNRNSGLQQLPTKMECELHSNHYSK